MTTWFTDDPTTRVGSDMSLYCEEGNPGRVVTPDVFVVMQTHKGERLLREHGTEPPPGDVTGSR